MSSSLQGQAYLTLTDGVVPPGMSLEEAAYRAIIDGTIGGGGVTTASEFYISTSGSDSNDGLTPTTPVRTIAQLNSLLLNHAGFVIIYFLKAADYNDGGNSLSAPAATRIWLCFSVPGVYNFNALHFSSTGVSFYTTGTAGDYTLNCTSMEILSSRLTITDNNFTNLYINSSDKIDVNQNGAIGRWGSNTVSLSAQGNIYVSNCSSIFNIQIMQATFGSINVRFSSIEATNVVANNITIFTGRLIAGTVVVLGLSNSENLTVVKNGYYEAQNSNISGGIYAMANSSVYLGKLDQTYSGSFAINITMSSCLQVGAGSSLTNSGPSSVYMVSTRTSNIDIAGSFTLRGSSTGYKWSSHSNSAIGLVSNIVVSGSAGAGTTGSSGITY